MNIGEVILGIFTVLMISITAIVIFAPRENIKEVTKEDKKQK